jgi:hypothetical protein
MVDQRGTLELLAEELGSAFAALQEVLRVDSLATLFFELGLDDPLEVGGDPQFVQKLTAAADQCSALEAAVEDLTEKAEADDVAGRLEAVAHVVEAIGKLTVDLDAVATDLKRATAGAANAATIAAFAEELAGRLLERAVVRYLEQAHPAFERILAVLTLVEVTPRPLPPAPPPAVGTGDAAEFVTDVPEPVPLMRRLHLDRLGQLLQDPLAFAKTAYDWGEESFDGKKLFVAVSQFFDALGPLSAIDEAGDAAGILSFFVVSFAPTTDVHPPGIDGLLHVDVTPSPELVIARPSESWRFSLRLAGAVGAGLELRLLPPAEFAIVPQEGTLDAEVRLGFVGERPDPQEPFVVFGQTGGSRLQARRLDAGFVGDMKWDGAAGRATADVGFEADVTGGALVLDPSGFDGFLSSVLPADGLRVPFDFGLTWSAERGFAFRGAAGLDATLPVSLTLGAVNVSAVRLGLVVRDAGLSAKASVSVETSIGPVRVVIDQLGVAAALAFAGNSAILGVGDVQAGFAPPTGLGLSVDAGVVTGGGFLAFDDARGQFAGAMELEFSGIAVKALGLLTTRLAGGRPGYSLLVIVSAELPPVQLGLGFRLVGVGGLLGINRTVAVEALRAGLKTGALGAVLSPPDPKASAGQLVAGLAGLFPAAAGRHVFAPTARIVWGSPTLITIDLCLVLELPAPVRLVALGRLRALLPDEREPIVRIQVDVLGVIEFDRRAAAVDATLVDSRLAQFALTGDLALRMSWGDQPAFLLAVGGFHPSFAAPPGFPALERVAVALASGDNPKLRLEAYLALTSNTVQFGARVDLGARAGSFSIAGFLSFDALVTLAPLAFVVDIAAKLAVKAGGHTLLSVSLALTLSGPRPWRARGRASFSILFFDVSFGFDVTIGDETPTALPAPVDVAPLLLAALADPRAWSAQLPAGADAITLRKLDPGTAVLAHPLATLQVRQRVAPLERTLDRFGSSVPSGARRFGVTLATIGGVRTTGTPLQDRFAPAQFTALSDDAKLSAPSFEEMVSGAALGADGYATGPAVSVGVVYEQLLVTAPGIAEPKSQKLAMPADVFGALTATPPRRAGAFAVKDAG